MAFVIVSSISEWLSFVMYQLFKHVPVTRDPKNLSFSCKKQQQEETEEEEEKVVMSPNQVSLCMDCGMIIQTEQGLLNHQKFCKQVNLL